MIQHCQVVSWYQLKLQHGSSLGGIILFAIFCRYVNVIIVIKRKP